MNHYPDPKQRASRYIAMVMPPPTNSLDLAIEYATAALDRSIPLLSRWIMLCTAIRITGELLREDGEVRSREENLRILEAAGLCWIIKEVLGVDVCSDHGGPVSGLVNLANSVERGRIPITDRLVELLAQSVLVLLAPLLDRRLVIRP